MRYWLYGWFLRDWYLKIKYFFQRIFRGYDDVMVWDIYGCIVDSYLKPLKIMRKNLIGHPPELTFDEWRSILDKIIFSFEAVYMNEHDCKYHEQLTTLLKEDRQRFIDYQNQIDEGFLLFGKHFRSLWD
jgi:hypothetical protein